MGYFIPPAGKAFTEETTLRGKVMSYAMKITDSYNVVIKNIDFFGATLKASCNSTTRKYINKLRFDSLNFNFPCASKRMLGEIGLSECMLVDGTGRPDGKLYVNNRNYTFFNNTFHGADGKVLAYSGSNVLLDNNLFEYNDWTSTNSLVGDGVGLRPGRENSVVSLNDISGTCFGLQRSDGAGIQIAQRAQTNSWVARNWVHDSPKYGIRFDGEPPRIGTHGSVRDNVVFRLDAGGIQAKGDYHTTDHNLAFDMSDEHHEPFPGARSARGNTAELTAA